MGFKDLEAFNKTLLGKQIWRLLSSPNPLVNKVLKDKYDSKVNIFRPMIPKNTSWIWKELMEARDLVKKGLRKRIGNGKSAKIWGDKWLLANHSGTPTTPRRQECRLQKVEDLINNQCWNRILIFRYFDKEDAERILSISLCLSGREDSHYWIHNPKGMYTVRSRYSG